MMQIKNILRDLFFFIQILFYWPVAWLLLKPLSWIDKKTNAGYFKHLDKWIKIIAGK